MGSPSTDPEHFETAIVWTPVVTGAPLPLQVKRNFTGTVLPSLNDRMEFPHVPPVASAPPIGSSKPLKLSVRPDCTVTLNVQLLPLPAASWAVHVTGVVPVGKLLPLAGVHVTGSVPSTKSV